MYIAYLQYKFSRQNLNQNATHTTIDLTPIYIYLHRVNGSIVDRTKFGGSLI